MHTDSDPVLLKPANQLEDEQFRRRVQRTILYYVTIVLAVLAICYLYQAVMGAFLISLLLVYLLRPLLNWVISKGFKRGAANILVVGGLFCLLAIALGSLIPVLYKQALLFSDLMPRAYETLSVEGRNYLYDLLRRFSIEPSSVEFEQNDFGESIKVYLSQYWSEGLQGIIGASSLVFSSLLTLILIPVFTFSTLYHWPAITSMINKLTPPSLAERQSEFLSKVDRTMQSVIQGQLLVALSLGILYMFGFSLIGVKAGILIGFICGICRLIPYLDILAAIILCGASVATHFIGASQAIGVIVVIALVQSIDGVFITPKVLGGRVGLHPVVVIASVLSFGDLFGLVGVLLAIPVAALVKVFIEQFLPAYARFVRHVGWFAEKSENSLTL